MQKFIIRLSLFGLAVAWGSSLFLPLAVLIPVLLPVFFVVVFIVSLVLLYGTVVSLLWPRSR